MGKKYNILSLEKICKEIFYVIGCNEKNANTITEVLISAEKRGINSHGLIRIKDYYEMFKAGRIKANPNIQIERESPSTAVVYGDSGFGAVVGHYAMELAIKKAKESSTAWIAVNNSNHFGIAAYYSMMALEEDMIGIAMTNANPLVAPTFSIDKFLGTNPIAVAVPTDKQPPFIADFATTPIARGKLAVMHKLGQKAEKGLVQDAQGGSSCDPNVLTEGGAILPLGGDRAHGSHKGYCMTAIVDILSAVLSGANFGPFVPPQVSYLKLKDNLPGKGLGHFFGAMRIDAFQDAADFKNYMDLWIETFRNAQATEGETVIIPGDPEREKEILAEKEGIELLESVKKDLITIADELKIDASFLQNQ